MTRKVPLYYLFIGISLCSIITLLSSYTYFKHEELSLVDNMTPSQQSCTYKIKRLHGYKFIRPLVYVQSECESPNLSNVRQELQTAIDNYKQIGTISSASIYLRVFGHGEWTCINDTETFRPGSLMKVPELITFLRENELHPGTLDKVVKFERAFPQIKNPVYTSNSIEVGKSYTIRELLRYMITYSDNNATMLLNRIMNSDMFIHTFTDLGLKAPIITASDYPITTKEFSLFFEELYNAGYLTIEDSEFAVELLTTCNFSNGLVAGLPPGTTIAHKFGEAGNGEVHELHESGIIISGNKRYQITIMTKGAELSKQAEIIKNLSKLVYDRV